MADRDGGVLREQKHCGGFADDDAAADDDRVFALYGLAGTLDERHDGARRAGREAIPAGIERAGVGDGQTVHVLFRRKMREHLVLAHVPRKRHLQKDAVHGVIRVQLLEKVDQLLLLRLRRKRMGDARKADLRAVLETAVYVLMRCGIVTDDHNVQPGLHARILQTLHAGDAFIAHFGSDLFSVDNICHSVILPAEVTAQVMK